MPIRVVRLACALLAMSVMGCGSSGAADPVPVIESSTGDLGPRAYRCAVEVRPIAGMVTASVTPASIFLELRQGTCAAPGAVAAVSPTGRLAQNVRAGVYQVSLASTSDVPVSYTLTVQYTKLSN